MKMYPPLGEEVLIAMRYLLWAYETYPEDDEDPADRSLQGHITQLEHAVNSESQLYNLLWGSLPWNGEINPYELAEPFFVLMKLLHDHRVDVDCYLRLPEQGKSNPFESEWVQDPLTNCNDTTKNIYAELVKKRAVVVKLQTAWPLIELLFMAYIIHLSGVAENAKRNREDGRAAVTNAGAYYRFLGLPTLLYHRRPLHDFFSFYLAEYLFAFVEGRIDWDPKNMWRWDRQKEYMQACLAYNREQYGEVFWLRSFTAPFKATLYFDPPTECRPLEALFALETQGMFKIEKFMPHDSARSAEFKLTMLQPEPSVNSHHSADQLSVSQPIQGTETWIAVGDFQFCHDPLMLKFADKTFRYASDGGKISSEEDKNRRKALKTLSIFVPKPRQGFGTVSFIDLASVARALNVSEATARAQLSIARRFLEGIGSRFTISYLTESKTLAAKEPIALITQ